MREKGCYTFLELEDTEETNLAEIDKALDEGGWQNVHVIDTRVATTHSESVGYNGNIMVYSKSRLGRQATDIGSILSNYFRQEDVTLTPEGAGFENRYYQLINQ